MLGLLKRRAEEASGTKANNHESVDTLACQFTGTVSGYFEIWVVNLLVKVCSLGLMRPWAEARRRRYFYGHTWLGRHSLAYTERSLESPLRTAGGLAAMILIVAVFLLQPVFGLVLALVGVAAYPWFRHRAIIRRATATTFRGRCFSHRGDLRDCYLRLLGWPLLTVLLAFVPLGHSLRSSWGHKFENYCYGDERFSAKLALSGLWRAVALTAVAALLVVGAVLSHAVAVFFVLGGEAAARDFGLASVAGDWSAAHYVTFAVLLMMVSLPYAVWQAKSEKLLMAGVRLDVGVSFDSEMSALRLSWLYVTNAIAIAVSLGFAIPWAAIRVARYRASVTTLLCYASVDDLADDRAEAMLSLQQVTAEKPEKPGPSANEELSDALDAGEIDLPMAA